MIYPGVDSALLLMATLDTRPLLSDDVEEPVVEPPRLPSRTDALDVSWISRPSPYSPLVRAVSFGNLVLFFVLLSKYREVSNPMPPPTTAPGSGSSTELPKFDFPATEHATSRASRCILESSGAVENHCFLENF